MSSTALSVSEEFRKLTRTCKLLLEPFAESSNISFTTDDDIFNGEIVKSRVKVDNQWRVVRTKVIIVIKYKSAGIPEYIAKSNKSGIFPRSNGLWVYQWTK